MPTINSEAYFSELPQTNIQRSIFNMPFNHKTSFNVGQLIPFYVQEVVPGDTFQVKTSVVARLQTLLTPVMDNINLEVFYFFCPNRLVDDHWINIMGENDDGPWIQDKTAYSVPYLTYPTDEPNVYRWRKGTIADYFGIPLSSPQYTPGSPGSDKEFPMVYPFRAYAMIVNEYFRDQNIQQPVVIHKDSVNREGSNGSNYITDLELGGMPFVVSRYHDYFSSCLPAPQRSEAISIFGAPLGSDANMFPVNAFTLNHELGEAPVRGHMTKTNVSPSSTDLTGRLWYNGSSNPYNATFDTGSGSGGFYPDNLWVDMNIPSATITQLRLAFQLQKYYEKSARGGSRYREFLREFFGVSNGDARMQVPEYLGGHRFPLAIHQVANTSQSDGADLGDLGAMSNTSDVHDDFYHSFSEHGFVIGVMCARFPATYGQGLERFWSRRTALDFYNPVFAHISEQPVYTRELYLNGISNDQVFGYNEAWSDYRYKPNRCSSSMRPEVSQSLASWHLADDYDSAPTLSSEWLQVNKGTVDRVLAVQSSNADQVFCDIQVMNKATRPMPVHSVPGFADHF